jgi:putative membrane protein
MKESLNIFLKGVAMGTANIIPGVSGGTIALITGIFERLINAIKSFNITAIKLLLKGNFSGFAKHTDLLFLIILFAGVGFAIVSLARIFEFLFREYPVYIWSYFFGLILASVYFVGKTVSKWSMAPVIAFIFGSGFAIALTFMNPATENSNFIYLIFCGVAAVCSMILPGVSGSFILILMGNYQLVAIDAINNMRFDILLPVLIGASFGLLGFSYLLSWVFKKFRDQTIALLTGFILGSLGIIWPWKKAIYMMDAAGNMIMKKGEPIVVRYLITTPPQLNTEFFIAVVIMILGIASIWFIEKQAAPAENKEQV